MDYFSVLDDRRHPCTCLLRSNQSLLCVSLKVAPSPAFIRDLDNQSTSWFDVMRAVNDRRSWAFLGGDSSSRIQH